MTGSARQRRDGPLELVAEQRLERRAAARTFTRAALRAVNAPGRDRHGIGGEHGRKLWAVGAVGDASVDHGVNVEPEAERQHDGDGSADRHA